MKSALSRRWFRLEMPFVFLLLALQVLALTTAGPESLVGADWYTFSRVGPETRDIDYWLNPEAFNYNYWSVGYSAFVGLFLETRFSPTLAIQVVQGSMAIGLAVMVYLFAFRFGPKVRLVSLFLATLSPSFYWMAWNGGYEVLLSFLICLGVLLVWLQTKEFVDLSTGAQIAISLSSGLLLGLATLVATKSILVAVAFLLCLSILRFRFTLAVAAGLALPLLSWAGRNQLVLGSPNPFNRNGPVNLWIGNNPDASLGGFMTPPELPDSSVTFVDASIRHMISQPEFTVSLTLRKIARLLEPVYIYPSQILPPAAVVALHVVVAIFSITLILMLFIYAFGRLWAPPPITPPVGLLAVVAIAFLAAPIPFLAEPRFRTPVEPLVIVIAVSCVSHLFRRPWSAAPKGRRQLQGQAADSGTRQARTGHRGHQA